MNEIISRVHIGSKGNNKVVFMCGSVPFSDKEKVSLFFKNKKIGEFFVVSIEKRKMVDLAARDLTPLPQFLRNPKVFWSNMEKGYGIGISADQDISIITLSPTQKIKLNVNDTSQASKVST